MTNNLKGGILPIMKCDKCRDGFMIVKEGKGFPSLGCTNYKPDRTGFNNMISLRELSKSVHHKFCPQDKTVYRYEITERRATDGGREHSYTI